MQWLNIILVCTLVILKLCLSGVLCEVGNPYRVLGINEKSTLQEIRRAYKQLAKEWHPDKSSKPTAEAKFVEIKQAYELLADPERRKAFDLHGITDEDSSLHRQRHDYAQYARYSNDPFEDLFGSHGSRFNFNDQDISLFHKLSVTTRHFENNLMLKSMHTPHIVLFYSDWCFRCIQAAPTWRRMMEALEPLGVVFNTVHAGHEAGLARKAGIHSLPCIVMLLDNNIIVYKESISSVQKLVDFIRVKMPYRLISHVQDYSLTNFLSGWSDNKVRALIMEPRSQPRLRYLVSAFHFRHRVRFGFVQLETPAAANIRDNFKIHTGLDTLLLFNEETNHPVASVSMADIPTQTLHNIISSNQYLALPRLSNQDMLDALCPPEWNRPRKKLCVVLVTQNTDDHNQPRESLRKLALERGFSERVRFAYIYQEKQQEFISSLIENGNPGDSILRVLILWRRDTKHVQYEWFSDSWKGDNGSIDDLQCFNDTKQKLEETISRLLRASEVLTYEAEIKDLLDEHAQSLISRILTKLLIAGDLIKDHLRKEHILPILSILGSIAFILGVGYFMAYLVRIEEENIQSNRAKKTNGKNNNNGSPGSGKALVQELKLHELRAEKYNGLVRMLKPGCRTIVLLVDMQSRLKLLPAYHKAVWPYRKNKTLMFSHMTLERGLSWYSELVRLSLPEDRELKINPRNCIGTVLALNGHRKYYCMYHAKHPESGKTGAKRLAKVSRQLNILPKDPESGAFLGMDSSDSDSSDSPKILLEDGLLDGLPNWLDRLFEGTTHRYYINYWPDFTGK